jgi:hypothetical protein
MLNSRVFIPTLECLTTGDRLESRIPRRFHSLQYPKAMKQVLQGHEKWLEKVAIGKQMPIDSDDPTDQRLGFLTETWLYQLGRRRLVWCWNRSTYEQHAMWRFYGQRGVAIHSTVGVVRRALAQAGADGSASPVKEEVRFVLRVNPAITGRSNGALLDIAATTIIQAIWPRWLSAFELTPRRLVWE